jgi:hypothetical protein
MADEQAVPSDADLLKRLEEALFEVRRVIAGQGRCWSACSCACSTAGTS